MIKWGTVTNVNPLRVTFDGELKESPKTYKKPKGYTPILGDRVCFLVLEGKYVLLNAYNN